MTILQIMDRFCISNESYHELTQVEASLPKSYLVEGCIKSLNRTWEVRKTPGQSEGAELPFKELLQLQIQKLVSKNCYNFEDIHRKFTHLFDQ